MAGAALGRPVSYAGGWTFIEESDRQSSSVRFIAANLSVVHGPRIEVNRDQNFTVSSVHQLAKRWFGGYRAIYFFGGAGIAGCQRQLLNNRRAYGGVMATGRVAIWLSSPISRRRVATGRRGLVLLPMRAIPETSTRGSWWR